LGATGLPPKKKSFNSAIEAQNQQQVAEIQHVSDAIYAHHEKETLEAYHDLVMGEADEEAHESKITGAAMESRLVDT
jgi:F0F1-type ATP synthase membrane subunit b/b'